MKMHLKTNFASLLGVSLFCTLIGCDSGTADVACVGSLPFLLARCDGNAQQFLAEKRNDAAGNTRMECKFLMVVRGDSRSLRSMT